MGADPLHWPRFKSLSSSSPSDAPLLLRLLYLKPSSPCLFQSLPFQWADFWITVWHERSHPCLPWHLHQGVSAANLSAEVKNRSICLYLTSPCSYKQAPSSSIHIQITVSETLDIWGSAGACRWILSLTFSICQHIVTTTIGLPTWKYGIH